MASVMDWWNERKLKPFKLKAEAAHARFLELLAIHGDHNCCSQECARLCDAKRRARLDYKRARLAYLLEYNKRFGHTT